MASRAAQSLLRSMLHLTAARTAPATPCLPRFAVPPFSSPSLLHSLQVRTKKTKANKKGGKGGNKGREEEEEDQEDEHVVVQVTRKGKGKHVVEEDLTDTQLPGEQFELKELEKDMADAIDRLRVSLKQIVGRVDKVMPSLLDNVRVDTAEGRRPLNEYAAVSVKDGKELIVTCYEPSFVKQVSDAIYASPLGLAPLPHGDTKLRVPVPKADEDKRQQLVRDAQTICEKARQAIRKVRTDGRKAIKRDTDQKIIGTSEARQEGKKLDDATKKKTGEVDKIFEDIKKILLDE
ncbi:ribosome recycling factor [Rhodotorula toruloides]|uniref:Ribosome recycling factor n=1 Tax=Rhodotorula toruloides TaxID=5286 RepID=A0A511KFW2_RHOTO|nr:ribosome recycling factor [Rhodotorula toruloides]